MKNVYITILLLTMFSATSFSSDIYKLDLTLDVVHYPDSSEFKTEVAEYMNNKERTTNAEAKKLYEISAANAIMADTMGFQYSTTFESYIEVSDETIKRYRIEGLIPVLEVTAKQVNSKPVVEYPHYEIIIHDGSNYYIETHFIKDGRIRKIVMRDERIESPTHSRIFHNYFSSCVTFQNLFQKINNMSPSEADDITSIYEIRENLYFTMLNDKSSAYTTNTRWNQLLQKESIFIPQIILQNENWKQTFSISSIERVVEKVDMDALVSIPSDAYEENGLQKEE